MARPGHHPDKPLGGGDGLPLGRVEALEQIGHGGASSFLERLFALLYQTPGRGSRGGQKIQTAGSGPEMARNRIFVAGRRKMCYSVTCNIFWRSDP